MSERERLRRLHVENRLAELRSKYGRDLEDQPLPDWLDSLEGYQAARARGDLPGLANLNPSWGPVGSLARRFLSEQEYERILAQDREMGVNHASEQAASGIDAQRGAVPPAERPRGVLSASEAMSRLDQYGESPLFACPGCGEESAKASTALDYWRCTQCGAWGKASTLVAAMPPGPLPPVWKRP